ncbi:SART-1 protein [Chytridium lagenaria]|nr:SART-1 protein [Chytridium lagenaria]
METDDTNGVAEEVSLSVDETNRLRISLGLKPLNEKANVKNAAAEQNFANERKRQQRRLERLAIIERAAKDTKSAKLNTKLEGKGLGDVDDCEDDPLAWASKHKAFLEKQKRKAAKLAQKKAKEMDEMDAQEYTSADLAGLRVAHDLSNIKDDVLVLADKRVLDEDADEDELVSVALAESERLNQNLTNKKGKPGYSAYDDQFDSKPRLLSQYDEEIDGPIRHGFTLNASGDAEMEPEPSVSEKLKEGAVSLEFEKMQEIKDYYTKEEIASFNKPKKRKKKSKARQVDVEEAWVGEGGEEDAMEIVTVNGKSNVANKIDDVNFVDDDDLQEALSRSRKMAIQKKGPMIDSILNLGNDEDYGVSGGIVLSATSEFVNSLSVENSIKPQTKANPETISDVPVKEARAVQQDDDVPMSDSEVKEEEHAESSGDEDMEDVAGEDTSLPMGGALEEEPLVARGLGATVALLTQKGFIERVSEDQKLREQKQLKKLQWIASQKIKDKVRELEKAKEKARNKAKGGKSGGYVDEYKLEEEQKAAERKRMRELEEKFKDYTPDVNLKYTDNFGNDLDAKEAFRYLSHKFHGKTSGKMKTEKRLKKKEEELKLQQMLSADTPMNTSTLEKVKTSTSAHVVLSVGNRGLVPTDVSLSDVREVETKRKKTKAQRAPAATPVRSFITEVAYVDASQAIPSGNREKVAFGLSTKKRNAEGAGLEEDVLSKKIKKEGEA